MNMVGEIVKLTEVKLKDISKNNRGYYGIGASAVDYDENKYTYLRITDINDDGTLNTTALMSVDDDNACEFLLKENDIVFARTGASTGRNYFYDGEINNMVFAGFLIKFSLDKEKVNPRFIKYYCLSQNYKNWIASSLTGSTRPNINERQLSEMPIILPDREYQDRTVKVLDAITKKIKLNNQINDNLFEILKQYIKKNYYNNCNIEVKALNNIGRIQGGYAFKSKDLLDESTNNKIFKIKNITSNGIDIENTQCIYDEMADKIDKKFLLTQGNVIIAMTGAELGKTGYMYGNENRYFINQRVGVVRGNDIFSELYLNCIFLQYDMQNILNSKGYGSAQPNISTTDIENIEIPIPKKNELKEFYKVFNPIYNKLILNSEQNQYLIKLRNTLLPKLMNGEIDLDKIEI